MRISNGAQYTFENIKKIKWGFLEENNPISLYPVMVPGWTHIIRKTGRILGKSQKSILCFHEGKSGKIFVDHKEWTELGEYTLRKILKNPSFAIWLNKDILKFSDQLTDFTTKHIFHANLKKLSDKKLLQLYKEYENRHGDLYSRAIIPVYLELYKPHLTNYLVKYLENLIAQKNYVVKPKECFAYLTIPDKPSRVQVEERALLKIAQSAAKSWPKLDKKSVTALKKHAAEFCYLGYNFEGPAFSEKYFEDRLREFLKNPAEISRSLSKTELEKKKAVATRKKIIKDLKIDQKHQKLFQITREIIFGKDYRKMSLVKAYYQIELLLKEIGRRICLDIKNVRNLLPSEITKAVDGKKSSDKPIKRRKGVVFVVINQKFPGLLDTNALFLQMKKFLHQKENLQNVTYFHGQTAMVGKARGKVKIINSIKDLEKMRAGNILVSQMTNPDLVPAMKKASAIVTDLGGVTCHAAIVARELKIPCVIGTKIATKALKDGEEIFVDADQGEIKKN